LAAPPPSPTCRARNGAPLASTPATAPLQGGNTDVSASDPRPAGSSAADAGSGASAGSFYGVFPSMSSDPATARHTEAKDLLRWDY
jgi:hypothetical protein